MTYQEICSKLQVILDRKRYIHTIGVEEVAVELARIYGADEKKVILAALLHDCAKNLSRSHLLRKLEGSDIVIDEIEKEVEALLHAPAGAVIAQEEFGISDEEILRAIRYHTTGVEDMTLLDKIIYISDYIEPNRDCPGIEEVRSLAFSDIDKAIILASGRSIIYEINRNSLIHVRTIKMRNALLRKGERG